MSEPRPVAVCLSCGLRQLLAGRCCSRCGALVGPLLCVECDLLIDSLEDPHAAHEPGCTVDPLSEDWGCSCDARAHRACCRACRPVPGRVIEVIPGQIGMAL